MAPDDLLAQIATAISAQHQQLRTELRADLAKHEAVLRKLVDVVQCMERGGDGISSEALVSSREPNKDGLRSVGSNRVKQVVVEPEVTSVEVEPIIELDDEPNPALHKGRSGGLQSVPNASDMIENRHHSHYGLQRAREESPLLQFVTGHLFTTTIAWVIVIHTVVIGWQVEATSHSWGAETWQIAVDSAVALAFTVIYTIELVLRMFAYRWFFWQEPDLSWNVFDVVLTVVSWADVGFQLPRLVDEVGGQELKSVGAFRAVRIIRLIRILRVVRLGAFFKPLRLLVSAMMGATRSCLWLMSLLLLVVYTFALVFTQACTEWLENNPGHADNDTIHSYYGSIIKSMYTLFKSMSGGVSWTEPADALEIISDVYVAVFSLFMFFTFFLFLNVVTGVFCQMAAETALKDREEQLAALMQDKASYLEELLDLFQELDDFGKDSPRGMFTLQDLEEFLKDPRVQTNFTRLEIELDDAWSFFRLFDSGDGLINLEEFLEGCKRMRGEARALDVQMILFDVKAIRRRSNSIERQLREFRGQLVREVRALSDPHPPLITTM